MKKFLRLTSLALCFIMVLSIFAGCKNKNDGGYKEKYDPPAKIMTVEQYHAEIEKLQKLTNFTDADTKKLDELGDKLAEMIKYNTDDIKEVSGTKYYVSNDGDDKNDGKTPETAWATLTKANSAAVKPGDAILFNRGDAWRGYLFVKSGITYGAYGEGLKPVISYSADVSRGWSKTETENIWKYNEKITNPEVASLLFNYAEEYADLVELNELKRNNQFAFTGSMSRNGIKDSSLYLYCDKGNPEEVYDAIEVTLASKSVAYMQNNTHDVVLNNLKLCGGNDAFFATNLTNIKISYCENFWNGGNRDSNGTRLGGGAGAWFRCDGLYIENCHIYQSFDAGVSPQYTGSPEDDAVFKDYIVKDCLFEYCEYSFEYFNTQPNSLNNRFENMYFGYNFCRLGGYGFGDKAAASRYIKAWGHENTCKDCVIENNVFDRAASASIEVNGRKQTAAGNEYDLNYVPKMKGNIYIHKKDKRFATVQGKDYKFNEETYNTLKDMGFETGAVYLYAND